MKFLYDPTAPGCIRNALNGRTYKQRPGEYMTVNMGDGVYDRAHRVVWILHHGPIPEGYEVDHINGLRHDNRIENLRLASGAENMRNRAAYSNNAIGVKGMHRWQGYWKGQITVDGKVKTKVSKDPQVVEQWLHDMRPKVHGEFARSTWDEAPA